MKQETDLRIAISWCEKLEKDESQPQKLRVDAGVEKVKLTRKLKSILYPKAQKL